MKKVTVILFLIILGAILVDTADARWRLFRRRSVSTAPQAWYDADDQGKCEIEAKYMHEHGIRYHVFGIIGNYEGWGYGGPNCATCVPRSGRLTGDAHYGSIRVRSWR